jgi:hypothetical protein
LSVSSFAPLCPFSWHLTSAVACCIHIYAFTFEHKKKTREWVTLYNRRTMTQYIIFHFLSIQFINFRFNFKWTKLVEQK